MTHFPSKLWKYLCSRTNSNLKRVSMHQTFTAIPTADDGAEHLRVEGERDNSGEKIRLLWLSIQFNLSA